MGQLESDIINQVTQKTQSELILFFILVAVVLVIVMLPLYTMIKNDRKERRSAEQARKEAETKAEGERLDRYIQREAQIIQVVTQNTEAIAGLKYTLENSGVATSNALLRMNEKLDSITKADEKLLLETELLKSAVNVVKSIQDNISDDTKKILMMVDNIPQLNDYSLRGKGNDAEDI